MVDLEQQYLHLPDDYPDTPACRVEELEVAKTLTEKHLKYPPNKRPNYDKLAVKSPFMYVYKKRRIRLVLLIVSLKQRSLYCGPCCKRNDHFFVFDCDKMLVSSHTVCRFLQVL